MTVKSSVSLTDQQADFAKSLVEEGRYPSLSAVIARGLDLLRDDHHARTAQTEALRALLRSRMEGAFISGDEFVRRTDESLSELARRRADG